MKKTRVLLIASFLFFIAAIQFSCNKSGSSANTPSAGNTVTVSMTNMTFSPSTVTVAKGVIVKWENDDGYAHRVVSDDGITFDSGTLNGTSTSGGGGYYGGGGTTIPGGTYSYTTTVADTIHYHCSIHGYAMSGIIIVKP